MIMRSPEDDTVKVSVSMTTYNHERFIAQAIESVLMQRTDFPIELVIGEDCSTDNTRAIVRDYGERYSDRIRLLLHEHNLGGGGNVTAVIKACRGKYIAPLEGDDYWTDPLKLQKEVDFLETHPEYVLCHYDAKIVNEQSELIKPSKLPNTLKHDFSAEELIRGAAWILTSTACFRNVLRELPPEYFKVLNGDTFLFSILGNFGKSKYLGDSIKPDAYRVHSGGIWSSMGDSWQRAYNLLNTYYWLRMYYDRLSKRAHSQSFAHALLHADILYRLSDADQVHSTLADHLQRLHDRLATLREAPERIESMRACLSANLKVGAALASFSWQCWERGYHYLVEAAELDPDAWCRDVSLEQMFIEQGIGVAQSAGAFDETRLRNYLTGLQHHMPKQFHIPNSAFHRIKGRLYAEVAYRCYLDVDIPSVRRFTCQALCSNPLLVADIGMLRRALGSRKV